jgi:hypothetical protein
MDAVISAAYGRPRFFNPRHYDCPFPDDNSRPDFRGSMSRLLALCSVVDRIL